MQVEVSVRAGLFCTGTGGLGRLAGWHWRLAGGAVGPVGLVLVGVHVVFASPVAE